MKKFIVYIIILLSLIFLKLFSNSIINEKVIEDYNNKKYDTLIDALYVLNVFEPYIVYYNKGNILYQENNYKGAIEQYNKAIEKKPPEDKICKVRVNLSLAMLADIDVNDTNNILDYLNNAQSVLYEDGCANKNDDKGKNRKAEDLDHEIEMLKEQNSTKSQNDKNDEDTQDDENEDNLKEEDYKEIEEKLKEVNNSANSERQNTIKRYENYDNYEYYRGKKW